MLGVDEERDRVGDESVDLPGFNGARGDERGDALQGGPDEQRRSRSGSPGGSSRACCPWVIRSPKTLNSCGEAPVAGRDGPAFLAVNISSGSAASRAAKRM